MSARWGTISDAMEHFGEELRRLRQASGISLRSLAELVAFDYSYAGNDIRHKLAVNFIFEIPYRPTNAAAKALLGGWQMNGTFSAYSGRPFTFNVNFPAGCDTKPTATGTTNSPSALDDEDGGHCHTTCDLPSVCRQCQSGNRPIQLG